MYKLNRAFTGIILLIIITLNACGQTNNNKSGDNMQNSSKKEQLKPGNPYYSHTDTNKLDLSDAEWKKVLPEDVYEISRKKGTERPFSGKYWNASGVGTYYCAACGNTLFRSDAKFASACGWPSFFEQSNPKSIVFSSDQSHGMDRTEALCGRCGGHLGHLFDDGPKPTGKRYCMNSIVLDFVSDAELKLKNESHKLDTITLAAGCFWCIEAVFSKIKGVVSVQSGYTGGNTVNPTYQQVCTGETNHAEAVQVIFDKSVTNLDDIFKVFFTVHDPTTLNKQGADIGTQYRSAIFYMNEAQRQAAEQIIQQLNTEKVFTSPIVTKIEPLKVFYKAENYHDNYYANNKSQPYCRMVIKPKLDKLEKFFKDKMKDK